MADQIHFGLESGIRKFASTGKIRSLHKICIDLQLLVKILKYSIF